MREQPQESNGRVEVVRRLILSSISDDYENVDQVILRSVNQEAAKYRWTFERSETVRALAWLIENGLAKAYLLSSRKPYATEFKRIPSLDVVETNFRTYFYITKKGMELHLSPWPDEESG